MLTLVLLDLCKIFKDFVSFSALDTGVNSPESSPVKVPMPPPTCKLPTCNASPEPSLRDMFLPTPQKTVDDQLIAEKQDHLISLAIAKMTSSMTPTPRKTQTTPTSNGACFKTPEAMPQTRQPLPVTPVLTSDPLPLSSVFDAGCKDSSVVKRGAHSNWRTSLNSDVQANCNR